MSDQPKRATVWWSDAHGGSHSVSDHDIERSHKPMVMATTGWVVRDDEAGIMLAQDWMPRDANVHLETANQWRVPSFQPRACIVKVEYLEPDEPIQTLADYRNGLDMEGVQKIEQRVGIGWNRDTVNPTSMGSTR